MNYQPVYMCTKMINGGNRSIFVKQSIVNTNMASLRRCCPSR